MMTNKSERVNAVLDKLHHDVQYVAASNVLSSSRPEAIRFVDAVVTELAGTLFDFYDALQDVSGSVNR